MDDTREPSPTTPEPPSDEPDLRESGEQFDQELHDAEAEADDQFRS